MTKALEWYSGIVREHRFWDDEKKREIVRLDLIARDPSGNEIQHGVDYFSPEHRETALEVLQRGLQSDVPLPWSGPMPNGSRVL